MPGRLGIYGFALAGQRTIPPGKGHVDMHGALLSENTNVHPAFGMDYKVRRNRAVVSSIAGQQGQSVLARISGILGGTNQGVQ